MAVLYPGDNFVQVYRQLEELAGDPRQIATTTDGPGMGLVISDDLFNRWLETVGESAETDATEAPKKRPGRPRKTQES